MNINNLERGKTYSFETVFKKRIPAVFIETSGPGIHLFRISGESLPRALSNQQVEDLVRPIQINS